MSSGSELLPIGRRRREPGIPLHWLPRIEALSGNTLAVMRDRVWTAIAMAFLIYEAIWWSVWALYRPGIWFFVP